MVSNRETIGDRMSVIASRAKSGTEMSEESLQERSVTIIEQK
jgi:hypothetical protein